MVNNLLITIWVDDSDEKDFLEEMANSNVLYKNEWKTEAGTTAYQIACFAVEATSTSLDVSRWQSGYMNQIGFLWDKILSFQVTADC